MPHDIDLRKLRYFVAVAEELNFGRAAQRLHIAQPVLSRQIKAFESELGAELFSRGRTGTDLTPAGALLLEDGRPLLAQAGAVQRRLRQSLQPTALLTVGFMPGLMVTGVVKAFEELMPSVEVETLRLDWSNQTDVVRSGQVDAAFAREPFDHLGLWIAPMLEEPRDAVVPRDHPLARQETVTIGELSAERLLQDPAAVPEWAAHDPGVRRRATQAGAYALTVEDKLEGVAAGKGVVVLPRSACTFYRRPDVTVVPVQDLSPTRVVLAMDAGRRLDVGLTTFAAAAKAAAATLI